LSLTIAKDAIAECAETIPMEAVVVDRDGPIRMFAARWTIPRTGRNRLPRHGALETCGAGWTVNIGCLI
jgi:hypothetical protein